MLGRVDGVLDNFTVHFDGGLEFKFLNAQKDVHFPFHPGQRVRVRLADLLFANRLEGIVTKVGVSSVHIRWIASVDHGPTPAEELSPTKLKLLSCFSHTCWQLCDWCLFRSSVLSESAKEKSELAQIESEGFDDVNSEDLVIIESVNESSTLHCRKIQTVAVGLGGKAKRNEDKFDRAMMIVRTKTTVDVAWQDGSIGHGIDSTSLIPVLSLSDHEFVAQQYVTEKVVNDECRRVGVLTSVNAKQKTASVKWFKELIGGFDNEEDIVSSYELEGHPDYDYCYGDVVIRLPTAPVSADIALDLSQGTHEVKHTTGKQAGCENVTVKSCTKFSGRSRIGNITGFRNGDIEVTWADGMVSMVGPGAIYVVDSDDDEIETLEIATEDNGTQRTISISHKNEDGFVNSGRNRGLPIQPAALGIETRSDIFFKGFGICKDSYDHYFISANKQNKPTKNWLRVVHKDWNILKNNLPDEIHVTVYEDRMDLLRAVVVGAYGTPYQDGLFFFDLHLPAEYPNIPPLVYYHSGGWQINPNLYKDGKVCLSLLNTWTGRGIEMWDPSSSTILQILLSLQGLVLNSKPYFNETGYEKQIGTAEGEKHSLSYNENVFLLNCRTMMHLMRKPPKDFEDFVLGHFRRRGYHILKACDAYLKGYLVGSLDKDSSVGSSSEVTSNTVGFKKMLAKLVTQLYSSLSDVGAKCKEFEHLQSLST